MRISHLADAEDVDVLPFICAVLNLGRQSRTDTCKTAGPACFSKTSFFARSFFAVFVNDTVGILSMKNPTLTAGSCSPTFARFDFGMTADCRKKSKIQPPPG